MGILSDYTIEDLRNATLLQIQTAISNKLKNLTKRQLIILILKVVDIDIESFEIQDREEGADGPNGQIWKLRIFRDVLGNKLNSQRIEWTYYPNRSIDEITTIQFDAANKEVSRKVIKHFKDGRQPVEV